MYLPIPGQLGGSIGTGHLDPIHQLANKVHELEARMNAGFASIANGFAQNAASLWISPSPAFRGTISQIGAVGTDLRSIPLTVPSNCTSVQYFVSAQAWANGGTSNGWVSAGIGVGVNTSTTTLGPETPSNAYLPAAAGQYEATSIWTSYASGLTPGDQIYFGVWAAAQNQAAGTEGVLLNVYLLWST